MVILISEEKWPSALRELGQSLEWELRGGGARVFGWVGGVGETNVDGTGILWVIVYGSLK